MRYQEPIYIQNANAGPRNKDILNVNMSSDMCIFEAPSFSLSGASKIDCDCYCTPDFTLLEGGICQSIESISATTYGTYFTAYTGSVSATYDENGTNFYYSELTNNLPYTLYTSGLSDSLNVAINPDINVSSINLWDSNGSSLNGRLNNTGIWGTPVPTTPSLPLNQWIGFSKCIELETSGIYSVGVASDNRVRIKINGEYFYIADLFDTITFTYWRVFEITLSAGTNVIEIEGYNDNGLASFGAEIYNTDITTLSGFTTSAQLDTVTIFSTKDFRYETNGNIPIEFDLGESSGYSCPSGYFLNTCGTAFTCSVLVESGCTIPTNEYYIINSATTIPITFNFTDNFETFSGNNTTFNFEIYKLNINSNRFITPPVYVSDFIEYSAISGTSAITENIDINDLNLDGQYLIKGFYQFDACTNFINKLGKRVDTLTYRNGKEYSLYDEELDYYFTAIKEAEKPKLLFNSSNTAPAQRLFQQVILPISGETNIIITNEYSGYFILTLNGLVLAPNVDFSYSGNIVSISGGTISGDVITVSYTTLGGNTLAGDNIDISLPIVSGITGNEGSNSVYYNSTTDKYEIYTSVEPSSSGSILVMINGVTLASNIDYYQSITKPKRIILQGDLLVGDLITIVYFPVTPVINGIFVNNPFVSWTIQNTPELVNGYFSLQVSTGETFTDLFYSGRTDYIVGQGSYLDNLIISGDVGTNFYYRVKNEKNYETTCGSFINSIAYSDIIPVVIESNSINSY